MKAKDKIGKVGKAIFSGVGKLFHKQDADADSGSNASPSHLQGPKGSLEVTLHQARGLVPPKDAKAFFKGKSKDEPPCNQEHVA